MLKIRFNKQTQLTLISLTLFGMMFSATAESFNAYPGTYKSKLVSVEAANVVYLSVDVWSGYPRVFKISLPGIAIPVDHPDAPACQIELVRQALEFTNEFMTQAKFIKVKDIHMESTGEEQAETNIFTDQGSLASRLTEKGLARPASIDVTKPWC